jgi:hypothetical protein
MEGSPLARSGSIKAISNVKDPDFDGCQEIHPTSQSIINNSLPVVGLGKDGFEDRKYNSTQTIKGGQN